jgi:hypothetical protein
MASFKREAILIVKIIKYNQNIIRLLTARCRRFVLLNLMEKRWINVEPNNPVISHERGKDREVFTSGTYPWSFVTQIFHSGQPSHGGDRKAFEVILCCLFFFDMRILITPLVSSSSSYILS